MGHTLIGAGSRLVRGFVSRACRLRLLESVASNRAYPERMGVWASFCYGFFHSAAVPALPALPTLPVVGVVVGCLVLVWPPAAWWCEFVWYRGAANLAPG